MRDDLKEIIQTSIASQINLSEMNINDAEIEEIFQFIKNNKPKVEEIFISNNNITDQSADIILNHCSTLYFLKLLDLQFNKLNKVGIEKIYQLKKINPTLKFALHGNLISNELIMQNIKKRVKE